MLGLGVSGPQVVEGLHGQRRARPLERLRETVDVVRTVMRGDKVECTGKQIVLPLPGGQGKALRLGQPARPWILIHLATLGLMAMQYTGEAAAGRVGTRFVLEAAGYYVEQFFAGTGRAGRRMDAVATNAGGSVASTSDIEVQLTACKKAIAFQVSAFQVSAFQVSAMGSPTTNFCHDAFANLGYADELRSERDISLSGNHVEACSAVSNELALRTSVPPMKQAERGGSIVIASFVAELRRQMPYVHYVESKHGVVGIAKAIPNELAAWRIRVNTVHPTGLGEDMTGRNANSFMGIES